MMRGQVKSPVRITSAGWAAALFWAIYVVLCGLCLSAYWTGEPRLALTALVLGLPSWIGSLLLWCHLLEKEDDQAAEEEIDQRRETGGYFDARTLGLAVRKGRRKDRLRRRRRFAGTAAALLFLGALSLWTTAIWKDHGDAYGMTGLLLIGCTLPLFASMIQD